MTTKWHGGKGSTIRPVQDRKKFESEWDRLFPKPNKKSDCLPEQNNALPKPS